MLSQVSLHSAIKRDHFEQKQKKKKKKKARRNFFFGDYLKASFVTILKMDTSTCIVKV